MSESTLVKMPHCWKSHVAAQLWTVDNQTEEVYKASYEYFEDFRNWLEETLNLAPEEMKRNWCRYKFYADKKRKEKQLKAGMNVLLLLPTDFKLLVHLKGPYVIKEKISKFDYRINVNGKERDFCANLIRIYIERGMESCDNSKDAENTFRFSRLFIVLLLLRKLICVRKII